MHDDELEEQRVAEVHSAISEGRPVAEVAMAWGLDEAKRIINLVMSEYIGDFNKALHSNSPTGVDIRTFTSKYDCLWEAKLTLDKT
jgi:hypothetical protein